MGQKDGKAFSLLNFEESTALNTRGIATMNEFLPMITERDGVPVTTSRAVAEQFGKRHDNVLRDIESTIDQLNETEEGRAFNHLNFEAVKYEDAKSEARPAYLLTRDGFTLLAMGFTGAKALQFKVAYISAFNRMEALLRGGLDAEVLQGIERRLEALERPTEAVGPLGAGRVASYQAPPKPAQEPDGVAGVAASFLQALQNAVDSGAYVIVKANHPHNSADGELLGFKERDRIVVWAMLAYEIYAAAVPRPLKRLPLWGVLEMAGTIWPRDNAPKGAKRRGKKGAVIYLGPDALKPKGGSYSNK